MITNFELRFQAPQKVVEETLVVTQSTEVNAEPPVLAVSAEPAEQSVEIKAEPVELSHSANIGIPDVTPDVTSEPAGVTLEANIMPEVNTETEVHDFWPRFQTAC